MESRTEGSGQGAGAVKVGKKVAWETLQEIYPLLAWRRREYERCMNCGHVRHWHYRAHRAKKIQAPGVAAVGGCGVRLGLVNMGGTVGGAPVPVGYYCTCGGFQNSGQWVYPVDLAGYQL